MVHTGGADFDDDAFETLITDHDVATRTENEQRRASVVGIANDVDEFLLGLRNHELSGRPTNAQGGVIRHRFVVTCDHGKTVAVAFASTVTPSQVAPSVMTALPSSLTAEILPVKVTSTPSSVSGTTTGRVKRTW